MIYSLAQRYYGLNAPALYLLLTNLYYLAQRCYGLNAPALVTTRIPVFQILVFFLAIPVFPAGNKVGLH